MAWLIANWRDVLLAVVAIDSALIPLFPKAGILATIKNILSSLVGSPPAA